MPGPPSYITDERALIARLHRVEGQVQALQRQVRRQAPCTDILIQLSAATKALDSVALVLLDHHLRHCVAPTPDPIERNHRLDEASRAIRLLVHSQA